MPRGQAPYNKDPNTRDDNGKSFDAPMKANDGTKLMTRKETTPEFSHDGKGGPGNLVTVPETQTSRRVPESSKPKGGYSSQVTPGDWKSKDCIDGKMPK